MQVNDKNKKILAFIKLNCSEGSANAQRKAGYVDDMKKWVKISTDRFWTPTIFTLPSGMLYPFDDENGSMKWKMAEMVDISEEDQEKYPDPKQIKANKR